jgi:hypothetical protein
MSNPGNFEATMVVDVSVSQTLGYGYDNEASQLLVRPYIDLECFRHIGIIVPTIDTSVVYLQTSNRLTAMASGTLAYPATPTAGTVVLANLPNGGGTVTFTYTSGTPSTNQFSTIAQLTALINNLVDLCATYSGTTITIGVKSVGNVMGSATISGSGSFSGISASFINPFVRLQKTDGSGDWTVPSSAGGKAIYVNVPFRYLRIECGSTQSADRTFIISAKP